MRSSGAFGLAILALTITAAGCSSSTDDTRVTIDSGHDTGKADTSVTIDTGTNPIDSGSSGDDTGTPSDTSVADTKDAGPAASCDPHTGDECNLVANNCPSSQTCDYTSAGHNQCTTPKLGPNQDGDACTDTIGCAAGLLCQPTGSTGTAGICTRPCCPGNDTPCHQNGQTGSCKLNIVDSTSMNSLYHLCVYNEKVCHPFKYDCPTDQYCIFSSAPDVFTCTGPSPTATLAQKPGGVETASNDCGESQVGVTTKLTDGGTSDAICRVTCWLTPPTGFTVGTTPGGRFPANGTCMIGGVSYGTCQSINFPDNTASGGGHLGACIP